MIELYISDQVVPVLGDDTIRTTKAITDIEDPAAKTGTITKSFKCPGTAEVNELFNNLFEVKIFIENDTAANFAPDFNPNLKASCSVVTDGLTIFKGYVRLLNITITNENQIEYELNATSDFANFINDLGADSLDQVELVMALEDEFGLEIADEEAQKLTTVGAAIEYVKSKSRAFP